MTVPLTMPPADFVIVTALEEERDAVLGKLPNPQKLGPFGDDIRVYFSSNLPVTSPDSSAGVYRIIVMPLLGMGRVEAATATVDAIRRWCPRYIILVGIAGGVAASGVKLGDVLVSEQIVDYELQKLTSEGPQMRWQVHRAVPRLVGAARNFSDSDWLNMVTTERPARGKPKRHMGPVASGDKVIAAADILAKYRDKWPRLIGVEMEAAGVATAAFQAVQQPGFFMVRGVSDLADKNKDSTQVKKWRRYACDAAASYAIALLESGPVAISRHSPEGEQRQEFKDEPSSYGTDSEIELPGGTMRPDSKLYIERAADHHCWGYLSKAHATTVFIQAPRQMGKSSLMHRSIDQIHRKFNKRSVFIDFQKFPARHFADEESFLIELCLMIGDALEIPEEIDRYWKGRRTNIIKCSSYLSDYVIPKVNDSFILAMDELERMLSSPFRNDFFGMMRTWHNDRVYDENFAKMTLFLSSSTEPYLFIDNPSQSPFNVAETISLQDFTEEEVKELNRRYESPLTPNQIRDLVDLVGGHPYLTSRALYLLATGKIDLETLLAQAAKDNGPFEDHLSHYLRQVSQQPDLKQALIYICHYHTCEADQKFHRLKGAGLVKRTGEQVVLRNKLYALYFEGRLKDD